MKRYYIPEGTVVSRRSNADYEEITTTKAVTYTEQDLVYPIQSSLGSDHDGPRYFFKLPQSAHPWQTLTVDKVHVKVTE